MASKIILKKSNVASKVPAVGDLDYGELALNYTDGKLWYKTNSNVIAQLNASTVGPGGSTPTTGTATIDFGAYPGSNEAVVTVTGQSTIATTSVVTAQVLATATSTDHTADDHKYFPIFASLTTSAPSAGTGFTIYARSTQKLTGTWTINWSWI